MRHTALFACALLTCTWLSAAESRSLSISTSAGYLPGVPILVRVEVREQDGTVARDIWDAQAALSVEPAGAALVPATVRLLNGIGSALVQVQATGDVTITAAVESLTASRAVSSLAAAQATVVSGSVAGPIAEWSGVVHVTGPVTVPAGVTLRLLPGTLVLIDGVLTSEIEPGDCVSVSGTPTKCGKSITVRGAIESLGTEAEPVTITASDPARAWGEIHHDGAAPSLYQHTIITRAGNSPRGGHTNTGPGIRSTGSTIHFEQCSVGDLAGKSMQASGSDLEFRDTLLTRSKSGPEIDGTALIFDRSYLLELKGKPPLIDDNDGIYLHSQRAGQEISLTGSIFADGDDDGIDTLDSTITVEDCIIRDWRNPNEDAKGISVFSGEVDVRKCLVVDNKEGIVAKGQTAGAVVHIDRSTIADNPTGIRAEDKFSKPDLRIKFFVENSIVRGPEAVKTDYPQFPDDIQIKFSEVEGGHAGAGNTPADPQFMDVAGHDYHLKVDSPCIDAGDPASSADPDGTRADMGVFPFLQSGGEPRFLRGRVNADDSVDISDAVLILLHLFLGGEVGCRDAADIDDDGFVRLTDAVYLLGYLFRAGDPPAPPATSCGVDPTDDATDCASPTC